MHLKGFGKHLNKNRTYNQKHNYQIKLDYERDKCKKS